MANENLMKVIDKALETYKAGGSFAKGRAEQLKTAERKYTTGAQAGLTGRGLSGTTIAASIPGAFEQDVAAPYRTETERLRSGQEMQTLLAKAGFLERDEERALREKIATEQTEAQKYSSSMAAAAQVHGRSGGGGGGAGGNMIAGWRARGPIDRGGRLGFGGGGGAGGTTGGARQHTGEGGGGFRGGGGGAGAEYTGVWQVDDATGKIGQIEGGSSPAAPAGGGGEFPEYDPGKKMSFKVIRVSPQYAYRVYEDGSKKY